MAATPTQRTPSHPPSSPSSSFSPLPPRNRSGSATAQTVATTQAPIVCSFNHHHHLLPSPSTSAQPSPSLPRQTHELTQPPFSRTFTLAPPLIRQPSSDSPPSTTTVPSPPSLSPHVTQPPTAHHFPHKLTQLRTTKPSSAPQPQPPIARPL